MTVVQIVKKYLEENGYDGLCNSKGECGCELKDLVPCWGVCDDCEPAYKIPKSKMTPNEKEFAEYEGRDFVYRPAKDKKINKKSDDVVMVKIPFTEKEIHQKIEKAIENGKKHVTKDGEKVVIDISEEDKGENKPKYYGGEAIKEDNLSLIELLRKAEREGD